MKERKGSTLWKEIYNRVRLKVAQETLSRVVKYKKRTITYRKDLHVTHRLGDGKGRFPKRAAWKR